MRSKFGIVVFIMIILSLLALGAGSFFEKKNKHQSSKTEQVNNDEYQRGYKDGFNDGYEKGRNDGHEIYGK